MTPVHILHIPRRLPLYILATSNDKVTIAISCEDFDTAQFVGSQASNSLIAEPNKCVAKV